jgi:NAD(P)-dependent dehydrogenase (short-subunit alcohol dehydrogenase family)
MSQNPIVLITGANTGLGLEIVRSLLQSNTAYTLLLCARSMAKAEGAVNELKEGYVDSRSEVVPMVVDIESDESIAAIAKEVEARYGRVDVLVNNAGVSFLQSGFNFVLTEVSLLSL